MLLFTSRHPGSALAGQRARHVAPPCRIARPGTLAAPRGAGHITSHPKSLLIFAANTLAKAAVKRPTIPDACRQQDDGTARHDIAQARTYAPGVVRRTRLAVTDRIGSPLALLPPAPALPATVLTTKTPHRSRPRKAATSIASPDASDGMWLTWAASATTARAAIAPHMAAIAAFTGAIHVTAAAVTELRLVGTPFTGAARAATMLYATSPPLWLGPPVHPSAAARAVTFAASASIAGVFAIVDLSLAPSSSPPSYLRWQDRDVARHVTDRRGTVGMGSTSCEQRYTGLKGRSSRV